MNFEDESPLKEESRPKRPKNFLVFLVLILLAVMLAYYGPKLTGDSKVGEVSFPQFLDYKKNNKVSSVRVVGDNLVAVLKTADTDCARSIVTLNGLSVTSVAAVGTPPALTSQPRNVQPASGVAVTVTTELLR